jgi:DNA-binding MarR family transcriptional regulator
MADRIPDERERLAGEVADLVHAVAHLLRRRATRDLEPLGVTWAQVRALRVVARHAPMRMSDLADHLRIARRSATSVVDELVDRGLVARTAEPGDRRAVVVEPTDAGRAVLDEVSRRRRDAIVEAAGVLDDDELRALHTLLRRLDGAGTQDHGVADG